LSGSGRLVELSMSSATMTRRGGRNGWLLTSAAQASVCSSDLTARIKQPGTRRAVRAREPQITAGRRVRVDRERARPYDGHGRHRLGSLLAVGATRAFPTRGCAASGCEDRHHADLLPRADGTLRSSPSSQRSAVQKQQEISKCRRR
jgi:hypothetical protein